MITCPLCGSSNLEGAAFCQQCDAILLKRIARPDEGAAKAGPRLIVARGGMEVPLPDKEEILVGRPDMEKGLLPDIDTSPYGGQALGVSRRHCRIRGGSTGFQVEDDSSKYGTFVNGQKLPPSAPYPLRDGDRLKLGELEFTFRAR